MVNPKPDLWSGDAYRSDWSYYGRSNSYQGSWGAGGSWGNERQRFRMGLESSASVNIDYTSFHPRISFELGPAFFFNPFSSSSKQAMALS